MKYILDYRLFESKLKSKKEVRGNLPIELPHIFNQIPNSVDYRIVKFICENFGKYFYKSPWSHSYYSDKVGWQYKPHLSYRLANHWNFKTRTGDKNIIHCETTSDVGEDNINWTIGQYDENIGKYNVIMSFPFIESEENTKKVKSLKEEYFKDYKYDSSVKIKISDEDREKRIQKFKYITDNIHNMNFYVDGQEVELSKWGVNNIKYIKDGVEVIVKHNSIKNISYRGILNGKVIIDKPLGVKHFKITIE